MKVSLPNYETPLFATKCSNGYWISYEYGKFLKEGNGKLKVFTQHEIEEFHEMYKQDFPTQYKQDLIKKECIEKGNVTPMFTARFDDSNAMSILKEVFNREAIDNSDGDPDILAENLQKALNQKGA
jgi:hypothetical protein